MGKKYCMEKELKKKKISTFEMISLVFAGIAIIISCVALKDSRKIAEYQIMQERLPRITGLNQTLEMELIQDRDGNIDFGRISEYSYPIRIPIYNVGVGIAQNCKVEWDKKSMTEAYDSLVEYLKTELDIEKYSFEDLRNENILFYEYDYLIEMDEGKPSSIVHYVNGEYVYDSLVCDINQYPFILPIDNDKKEEYIYLSDGMSTLLLEAMQREIETPVKMKLKMSYQDLTGKNYNEEFWVTFSKSEMPPKNVDNMISIDVSFETDGI